MRRAGQDATDAFEDIGHSQSARDMLDKYLIGDLDGAPVKAKKQTGKSQDGDKAGGGMGKLVIPVVVAGAIAYLLRNYM